MNLAIRRVRQSIGLLLLAVLLVLLVLGANEFAIFFGRTEESALARAQGTFLLECERRHLGADQFDEPLLFRTHDWGYEFAWQAKEGKSGIIVAVQYFPVGTEAWYVPDIGRDQW